MNKEGISAQIKHLSASLSDFFISFNWQEIAFCLKIALFIISVLMILAIIVVLIRKSSL